MARQASTALALVQPFPHFFAGLEEGNGFFRDRNLCPRARIAANPSVPVLHRKGAESAQFDPVSTRQGGGNFIKDCIDDFLDVAQVEMRVAAGDPLYKFGFDHLHRPTIFCAENSFCDQTDSYMSMS